MIGVRFNSVKVKNKKMMKNEQNKGKDSIVNINPNKSNKLSKMKM